MKKSPKKRGTGLEKRFVPRRGSPLTDEDAAVLGVMLQELAESNAVDGIRHVKPRDLTLRVKSLPKGHPVLRFYDNWDKARAAEKHWDSVSRTLIRSIHVTVVRANVRVVEPRPMFFDADSIPMLDELSNKKKVGRAKILADDVSKGFQERCADSKLHRLEVAVRDFTRFAADYDLPPRYDVLSEELVDAFQRFHNTARLRDKAAE